MSLEISICGRASYKAPWAPEVTVRQLLNPDVREPGGRWWAGGYSAGRSEGWERIWTAGCPAGWPQLPGALCAGVHEALFDVSMRDILDTAIRHDGREQGEGGRELHAGAAGQGRRVDQRDDDQAQHLVRHVGRRSLTGSREDFKGARDDLLQ